MKKILIIPFSFLFLSSLLIMSSCSDDGDDGGGIIIDPGTGDVNVADGTYLALEGEAPSSLAQFSPEVVAAPDFMTQSRDGFIAGSMWLEAGNYNLVTVADKEITSTIGGTAENITDEGSTCGYNDYSIISTSEGGSAFNIGTAGFYQITYDAMTNELVPMQIQEASIIGNATEGGWSNDTPLAGSITADGGSFSASDVLLREGLYKIRLNCRWSVFRGDDYEFFTNFGGSPSNLLSGGANMEITEDGLYSVTLTWAPRDGWAFSLDRTGDAPMTSFNPEDFSFGIIGDATAGSWDSDQNMTYKVGDGTHNWHGVITFADAGQYKFRTNDAWDFNLGGSLESLVQDGDNLVPPAPGAHYIVISTADEGETWSATMSDIGWSIIGEGGPNGDWENDADMTADGFVDGVTTYSITGTFVGGAWKFRAGHAWDFNLGGDMMGLTLDGANIETAAGDATVTLSFDGETYSASVQ